MRQFFLILTASLILKAVTGYGQIDTLEKQNSLLKQLRKAVRIESEGIGYGGEPSEIYKTAKSLWNISSIHTLTKMTDDKNPIIKYYAFWGLIEKKADKKLIREIADKHLNDTTTVKTMFGCIVFNKSVISDLMRTKANYYCQSDREKKEENIKGK